MYKLFIVLLGIFLGAQLTISCDGASMASLGDREATSQPRFVTIDSPAHGQDFVDGDTMYIACTEDLKGKGDATFRWELKRKDQLTGQWNLLQTWYIEDPGPYTLNGIGTYSIIVYVSKGRSSAASTRLFDVYSAL